MTTTIKCVLVIWSVCFSTKQQTTSNKRALIYNFVFVFVYIFLRIASVLREANNHSTRETATATATTYFAAAQHYTHSLVVSQHSVYKQLYTQHAQIIIFHLTRGTVLFFPRVCFQCELCVSEASMCRCAALVYIIHSVSLVCQTTFA